jgi:adenine-specific DNA-methyltransferase
MPELVWDGKYDKDGKRVGPVRVALPFQTVETVNESVQERQRSLDLFTTGHDSEWRNRLIWGDKKYVLPALVDQFAGRVDLIYIDPPFATGDDFSIPVSVDGTEFDHEPTLIEQKAYRDTWGVSPQDRRRGVTPRDRYVRWLYDTVVFLHSLLAETGSMYLHLDWRVCHYAKLVMDEVFGSENFQNEIIWHYRRWTGTSNRFQKMHDVILFYTKSENYTFNRLYTDYTAGSRERKEQGVLHRFKRGEEPVLVSDGALTGDGVPENDVWQIPFVAPSAKERLGFPTQKPRALLERILSASSDSGDLVLDCFCGSGTTADVAEQLGRRWIAADLGRFAVHTTRKRMLAIPKVTPFVVQNLGRYERQLWQVAEFGDSAVERIKAYRRFILDLYRASAVEGYAWIHGLKSGRLVHVGTVDAPVTVGDVKSVAAEFRKMLGTGAEAPTTKSIDILGWDFAFELNEVARQEAAAAGIEMRFVRIPREVLERRAVDQGDIRFFELAALGVELRVQGRRVSTSLTDFVIPLDDVPDEVRSAITSWTQWIDYWAIDWDNKDDTFHNQWQSYRTRKNSNIDLSASYDYDGPGTYTVVVKVIDILGNDTTKSVTVEIPTSAS